MGLFSHTPRSPFPAGFLRRLEKFGQHALDFLRRGR
jgi:hypothetical protein